MSNKNTPLPSREKLLELFSYDPESGVLTRHKPGRGVRLGPAGNLTVAGYLQVGCYDTNWKVHRLIWMIVTGEDPGLDEIDHQNGIRNDNRWSNLRRSNRSNQTVNSSVSTRNTSGFKGVIYSKGRRLWGVKISVKKIGYFLGFFKFKEDAVAMRLAAENYLHAGVKRDFIMAEIERQGLVLPELPESVEATVINHGGKPYSGPAPKHLIVFDPSIPFVGWEPEK